jgi:hypothetical protein
MDMWFAWISSSILLFNRKYKDSILSEIGVFQQHKPLHDFQNLIFACCNSTIGGQIRTKKILWLSIKQTLHTIDQCLHKFASCRTMDEDNLVEYRDFVSWVSHDQFDKYTRIDTLIVLATSGKTMKKADTSTTEESLDPSDWTDLQSTAHQMIDDAIGHIRDVRERPLWQNMPETVRDGHGAQNTHNMQEMAFYLWNVGYTYAGKTCCFEYNGLSFGRGRLNDKVSGDPTKEHVCFE